MDLGTTISGFFRIFWDFSGFFAIVLEIFHQLWNSLGFSEHFFEIFRDYLRFLRDFWDFSGFFGIFRDSLRFLGEFWDCFGNISSTLEFFGIFGGFFGIFGAFL